MRIVLAGASGFVGQLLTARLAERGCELLLAGRNPSALARMFPQHQTTSYAELAWAGSGFDILINLAVRNTDQPGDLAAFEATNVTLVQQLIEIAKELEIPRFLNVSSLHALDLANHSPYAVSKRKADAFIEQVEGIDAFTLHLPIVYGDTYSGKLSRLNGYPDPIIRSIFPLIAALKPTVHVDLIVEHIMVGGGAEILSDGQACNPAFQVMRTIIDWSFALIIIVFFWWVLAITWIVVKKSSPGPGLFIQERIGKRGAVFKLYKFRTMAFGTKEAGTHETPAASITKVGAFLRITKLDELPQVFNILKGQLSLIGPRPCLPTQEELIAERKAHGVLDIQPGISGLAQIEGLDMSDPARLAKRDSEYVKLQSIALDLEIAVRTALGQGRGDNAAR